MGSNNASGTILAATLALSCVTLGSALAADLKGADIKTVVAGKTVYVSTSVGSVPIKFNSNGTMRAGSTTIAKLTGVKSDTGRWWVAGSKLCQKWKTWLKGKAHCVSLRRNGKKYYWTSGSGKTGSARVSSNN